LTPTSRRDRPTDRHQIVDESNLLLRACVILSANE
jgi:hypothetical protein